MKHLIFLLFCMALIRIEAQTLEKQTLSNGGGYSENENLSLEWTLGEMRVNKLSNGNLVLTEGFHQGNDLSVGILEEEGFHLNIFPNPTQDKIQLVIESQSSSDFAIELFDLKGSKVLEKTVFKDSSMQSEIDLSSFENGFYILILHDKNSQKRYEWKVKKIK